MSDTTGDWVQVPLGSGETLEAWAARTAAPNGHVLVFLQEIFGINPALRGLAAALAGYGYVVLVPDLFWRQEPHVELGYDAAGMQRAFALLEGLDEAAALADISATVALAHDRHPDARGVHLLGLCLGGRLAAFAAPACDVDSAVAFYGVGIEARTDLLGKLRCPLQLHFGGRDRYVPAEAVAAVEAATAGNPLVEIHRYADAGHGFFNPGRDEHVPASARLAWQRSEALFERVARR